MRQTAWQIHLDRQQHGTTNQCRQPHLARAAISLSIGMLLASAACPVFTDTQPPANNSIKCRTIHNEIFITRKRRFGHIGFNGNGITVFIISYAADRWSFPWGDRADVHWSPYYPGTIPSYSHDRTQSALTRLQQLLIQHPSLGVTYVHWPRPGKLTYLWFWLSFCLHTFAVNRFIILF